jgi:DNA-binding beta-propeller fold protein YncE
VNGPRAISTGEDGYFYLALREGNAIYRIDSVFKHVAGTGVAGYYGDGGPARDARLSGPKGISWYSDRLYLADTESHTIRVIDLKTGLIRTVIGDGKRGRLARPHGVFVAKDGTVYVADSENHRILAVQ